jgi:hypothetical protein
MRKPMTISGDVIVEIEKFKYLELFVERAGALAWT